MSKKNCNTFGPDLEIHEKQGAEIAAVGLRIMKGKGATDEPGKSTGPDTSRNGLERLK